MGGGWPSMRVLQAITIFTLSTQMGQDWSNSPTAAIISALAGHRMETGSHLLRFEMAIMKFISSVRTEQVGGVGRIVGAAIGSRAGEGSFDTGGEVVWG